MRLQDKWHDRGDRGDYRLYARKDRNGDLRKYAFLRVYRDGSWSTHLTPWDHEILTRGLRRPEEA